MPHNITTVYNEFQVEYPVNRANYIDIQARRGFRLPGVWVESHALYEMTLNDSNMERYKLLVDEDSAKGIQDNGDIDDEDTIEVCIFMAELEKFIGVWEE